MTKHISHLDAPARAEWDRFIGSGMAELIKSYNLVHALFAFTDSGMVKRMREGAKTRAQICAGLDPETGAALLRFFAVRGVVTGTPDAHSPDATFVLTERGRGLTSDLSNAQMGFYREAYEPVLEKMTPLLQQKVAYPDDVQRNGEALGRHCTVGFHYFGTSVALRALESLGAKSVLDLGCGGGGFLIDACRANPALRGIGLDISEGAIEYARSCVAAAGLADRIQLVVGDAFAPETWPAACREAEAILTVGTLHEQFRRGEEGVISLLDRYAALMQGGKMKGMIVGEPELQVDPNDADFYLMHVFTKQGMPRPREGWLPVIEKTKLRCDEVFDTPGLGPAFAYYLLRPRA